jgi:hypothetical protein
MYKTLLFGMAGLTGALLTALLLGEPLWWLLRPAKRPPPAPEMRVSASPEVVVDQGRKNRFGIHIVRSHFQGPVQLVCRDLPVGVKAADVTLARNQEQADIEVIAGADAWGGEKEVTVIARASGAEGSQPIEGKAQVRIRVDIPPPPQVDILFVLDVTGSMQPQIDGVKRSIVGFADELEKRRLDARVGLLAFRDRLINEESVVLQFPQKDKPEMMGPFTYDRKRFQEEVGKLKASGGGDEPESSLDALALASRQPFRESANKVLIHITDASPHVPDKEIKSFSELNDILRAKKINQLHLILPSKFKMTYAPLHEAVSGSFFDLLEVGKTSDALSKFLPVVGREVAWTAEASKPPRRLPAATPPPPPAKGVQSSEEYVAGSGGRLVLLASLWTALVAAGICLALIAGQVRYTRQTWPRATEITQGLVGGLLVGGLGGLAAEVLFQITTSGQGLALEQLYRVGGWTLLGTLAGLGMAYFVPNLAVIKGMVGGALGGAAASGFQMLTQSLGAIGDSAGRLIGAAALGLCLGLMVALVERLFRRIWLEVRSPTGGVRSINLGAEPVYVGSDSRRCTVFVPQAPGRALRYILRGDQVELLDVVHEQTFLVGPGDHRQVGAASIVVCGGLVASSQVAQRPVVAASPPQTALPHQQHDVAVQWHGGPTWRLYLSTGQIVGLALGTRLGGSALPGLSPQGSDGVTAGITSHPQQPGTMGLTNYSRQTWAATLPTGENCYVEPGRTIRLASGTRINFGPVMGELRQETALAAR